MLDQNKPLIELWLQGDGSLNHPYPSLSLMVIEGDPAKMARTLLLGIAQDNDAWKPGTAFALSLDEGEEPLSGVNVPKSYASYRKLQGKLEVISEAGIFRGLTTS